MKSRKIPKIPKKRGRKPKEKIYSVVRQIDIFFDKPYVNKNIILHLPIKEDTRKKKKEKISTDSEGTYISFCESDDELNDITGNRVTTLEVKEIDVQTKKDVVFKKKIKDILVNFVDSNKDGKWVEQTDISCWWCCHQFKNPPCYIPASYNNEIFNVYGCFCSFNCALSYLFDNTQYRLWEKCSLLKLLYRKTTPDYIKLQRAPPRESLIKFGGYLSIAEFRQNFSQIHKNFRILKPPIISINIQIEEHYIPLDEDDPIIIHNRKISRQLRVKRSKPLKRDKRTLDATMGLLIN